MTVLGWVNLTFMVLAILMGLFFLMVVVLLFRTNKELNMLTGKRPKAKKQRKKISMKKRKLAKKKKSQRNWLIGLFVSGLLFVGGGWYVSYYEATNLTADDSDSIVAGYYLLEDFEKELDKAAAQSESEEKLTKNIRYLSSSLSTYGAKKASTSNTEEGQLALNRYYKAMGELGANASSDITKFYGNAELVEEYKQDIKLIKERQKKVLELYKVNEEALKQRK